MPGRCRARHPAAISITPSDKNKIHYEKPFSIRSAGEKNIGTRFQLSCLIINKRESLIVAALVYIVVTHRT